jgi:hypothetical protein
MNEGIARVPSRTSHDHFCGFCWSFLAPVSELFRPVGLSSSTPPAAPSRFLLSAVVHDFRLAPDDFHQAFFG